VIVLDLAAVLVLGCLMYKSKASAERAYAAYRAKKGKK